MNNMANKLFTISIIVLLLVAVGLGYLIYKQKTDGARNLLPQGRFASEDSLESSQIDFNVPSEGASDTQVIPGDEKKEFLLTLNENTQLFGIAKDDPYYGEPPAPSGTIGAVEVESFEIWGDAVSFDLNDNTISISADYPRPINTAFTPRGPKLSLKDIKAGDRIVASGMYGEKGEPDYGNIQFVQISPSLEEIKRLREVQGK